ncbi:MAG TPA: lanthionine synthetase C family protein, partial [Solirubrobacteraceae bacterium]|nr:lanthionine synthetase C family protein [Solirubrobacteraceae bacterium]
MRATDRRRVEAAVVAARAQTHFPTTVHWEPGSVAQGDAGLALLCAYADRCFPDEGWDVTGHGFLASAAAHAERALLGPSLYGGLAGLGFVAAQLGRGGARYRRLLNSVDDALAPQALALADALDGQEHGVPVGQFDAISGLSGVGAYLLMRRDRPHVHAALVRLLEALVDLTRASAEGPPRWFTPVELMFDEMTAAMYPDGHLNCGLAHGIPGPLALMALAHADGVEVAGLRDAIAAIAAWLCGNRADDAWGVNWPTMVALPGDAPRPPEPSRAAWCYGSPGVARSLWLAAAALDDDRLAALATDAMRAVYRRPLPERQIDSPTFCHGVAG